MCVCVGDHVCVDVGVGVGVPFCVWSKCISHACILLHSFQLFGFDFDAMIACPVALL